jgi:drug/metabolite transporter (DMT)-like permease
MLGLADVSPAVSAFLTSLYVLFTALLIAASRAAVIGWAQGIGVMLAILGAALVRGRAHEFRFNCGELLTIVSAFVFAIHILATDRITKRVEPMAITFTSFAWVAIASAVLFAFACVRTGAPPASGVIALLAEPDFLWPLVWTTVSRRCSRCR